MERNDPNHVPSGMGWDEGIIPSIYSSFHPSIHSWSMPLMIRNHEWMNEWMDCWMDEPSKTPTSCLLPPVPPSLPPYLDVIVRIPSPSVSGRIWFPEWKIMTPGNREIWTSLGARSKSPTSVTSWFPHRSMDEWMNGWFQKTQSPWMDQWMDGWMTDDGSLLDWKHVWLCVGSEDVSGVSSLPSWLSSFERKKKSIHPSIVWRGNKSLDGWMDSEFHHNLIIGMMERIHWGTDSKFHSIIRRMHGVNVFFFLSL